MAGTAARVAAPAGGVPVSYRSEVGQLESRADLTQVCGVRFERCAPVRAIAAFKGQSNFAGSWWCATTGSHVPFESWLERDQLMLLDFTSQVVAVAARPFRVRLAVPWGQCEHIPDFFARRRDGGALVIDVRPEPAAGAKAASVGEAFAAACARAGWAYERRGELDRVFAANLRWIAGYRHRRCRDERVAAALLAAVHGSDRPRSVLEHARSVGDPVVVLPTVFHLVWSGQLVVDLAGSVLRSSSLLAAGAGVA